MLNRFQKHNLVLVVLVASVAGIFALMQVDQTAVAQVPPIRHKDVMEQKLDAVNKVMEGIARSNFDTIAKQSQKLHLLSREAGWNVLATPTYLRLSEDFRATATQLQNAAEKKNLDAAGLAYVKLSISCIECHRYARKEMPRIGLRGPKAHTHESQLATSKPKS
ncbi:MAG: hypothetical protein AAF497_20835 [Planctomycetota bacterium]